MTEKVTYSLNFPVQFTESRRVEEISFKTTLTVGELKKVSRGVETLIEVQARTLAVLSGEPEALIDALDARDFRGIQRLMDPFLAECLPTGAPSAQT
jgi:hypothetical protein